MSETDETTAMVAEQNTRAPQREPSPATSLRRRLPMRLVAAFGGPLLFVAGGVTATRIVAAHVERKFVHRRFGTAGSTLRIMITSVGYCVVALTALSLIAVPLQQLVLGGALTG